MWRNCSLALGALMLVAGAPAMAQQVLPINTVAECSTSGEIGGRSLYATRKTNGLTELAITGFDTGQEGRASAGSGTATVVARDRSAPGLSGSVSNSGGANYMLSVEGTLSDSQLAALLASSGRYSSTFYISVWVGNGPQRQAVERVLDLTPFFPTLRALRACQATPRTYAPNQQAGLRSSLGSIFNGTKASIEFRRLRALGIDRSAPMTLRITVPAEGAVSCRVAKSSGNADVDRAFCAILQESRPKFATDAGGMAVSASFDVEIPVVNFALL